MYWYFDLEKIPDLSLTKYMSLDESGVNGVISKHLSFLRQLNRKGILSRVFFHLLYSYDPEEDKGKKLSISLIAEGDKEALFHTKELIQNSAVSPFYNIISNENCHIISVKKNNYNEITLTIKNHLGFESEYNFDRKTICKGEYFSNKKEDKYFTEDNLSTIVFSIRVLGTQLLEIDSDASVSDVGLKEQKTSYSFQSILSKREFFVQPSIILPDDNDLKYYKVSEWEMNNSARLYNMLKLMEGLDSPVTYRVDLFAVDYALRLRDVLPIKELRARTSMKATKTNTSVTLDKDKTIYAITNKKLTLTVNGNGATVKDNEKKCVIQENGDIYGMKSTNIAIFKEYNPRKTQYLWNWGRGRVALGVVWSGGIGV